MIAYIRGKVAHLTETKVIVDVHDIGYQIFITARDASAMPPAGDEVLLHTFFNVKEDAMQLFGFLSKDDMEIFKLLLGVNGVWLATPAAELMALALSVFMFKRYRTRYGY